MDNCLVTTTAGATCADGSKYAGIVGSRRYAKTSTRGALAWATQRSYSTAFTSSGNAGAGPANMAAARANDSTLNKFPAFQACNGSIFGKQDWFLPTQGDLGSLLSGGQWPSADQPAWTSSFANGSNAYAVYISSGSVVMGYQPVINGLNVYCMRFLN